MKLFRDLKKVISHKDEKPLNVAIACYDLGEFCRFYPRGKAYLWIYFRVIESLQIKDIIMERARYSEDKSVREQALLALQKIMIQNWQAIWSTSKHTTYAHTKYAHTTYAQPFAQSFASIILNLNFIIKSKRITYIWLIVRTNIIFIRVKMNSILTKTVRYGKGHGTKAWALRHINDPYVKQAQIDNYRSRAAYKLK